MKRYIFIALVALTLILLASISCGNRSAESDNSQPKAAIIDQLYLLEPNPEFIEKTTENLMSYGFSVDLWQGEEITVEFYRNLPRYGYKLLVLRVHSGLLLALLHAQVVPSATTYIFTGETYTTAKYVSEQLTDRVSNALMTTEYPLVFAVNSEFIQNDLKGTFNDTIIIAMGCESHYYDDMAVAFMEKGASAYLGWSGIVSLDYVDEASLNLLGNLCTENLTVQEGVDKTMAELGYDPYFRAYLKYYPAGSGSQTIRELFK